MPLSHPRFWRTLRMLTLASAVLALPHAGAFAQSAFTYQGQLKVTGAAYNGTADLRFTLYTALTGGSIVGAPIDVTNVTVSNGLITASLNFGALAFDGSPRWIEVAVRTPSNGGIGPYTTLTPRQPINPSPYALYALNANTPFGFNGANAVYNGAGNVGVGTSTPTGGKLVVQTAASNYGLLHTDGTRSMGTWVGASGGWLGTLSNDNLSFATNNASGQMVLNTLGNVGIGNSTPDGRLHISGGPGWTTNGWTKSLTLDNATAIEFGKGAATRFGIGESQNGLYFFNTATDAPTGDAAHYFMWAASTGHVFMGNAATITGNSPLTVGGTGADWVIYGEAGTGGIGVVGRTQGANGRGVAGLGSAGYCGVSGDHVSGAYGLLGTANEGIYGNGGANNKVGVVGVSGGDNGMVAAHLGTSTTYAGIFGYSTASSGNGVIGQADTGTAAYGVWGRAAQGIGGYFTGGQYAIIAAGKAKVNTIEIIGGSDLAEPFDVAQIDDAGSLREIEVGMVVVIDPANPGALMISTQANDRKVAGVISGANGVAPGMVMKSEGGLHVDGDHPVALTGRVWCWCDASTFAIEPGDMLTTSNMPGHAMKVSDFAASQGAIVGKAMTPLAAGERGLVLVLVNLQ